METYVSPYKSPPTGYLVVEGFISSNATTEYSLTRSIGLPGDSTIPVVTGAAVQVEGSDSSRYVLPEEGSGNYGGVTLTLNPAASYRLRIITPGGGTYVSDFVPLKSSPAIDSVNWVYIPNTGVNIYVNTHDPTGNSRYYRWSYKQTWEYHGAEPSNLIYDDSTQTVVDRPASQEIYRCWKNFPSTQIMLYSTARLSQDVVSLYPLVQIPFGTQQISVLYSLLVSQFALTPEAYTYYSQMLANTESLGGIFDILPTELDGNIHNVSNPSEPVLGYISAGTAAVQRIYISYEDLPYWNYDFLCPAPDRTVTPDSISEYFATHLYVPLDAVIGGYSANVAECIDCTANGGTNQKPVYWPN